MIEINILTIIIGAALLLLAVITPFFNSFFRGRKIRNRELTMENNVNSPLSVILTPSCHDNHFEENLSLFLNQDYPGDYKVIVVAETGDSSVENVLMRMKGNPHLYTTFTPETSRYMSRKKLAITLGVKAAQTEWIILTEATCRPNSDKWLSTMASHIGESTSMIIGYTNYDNNASQYQRFERLQTSSYLMCEDVNGEPYRTESRNIAFRKSEFIRQEGFRGSLQKIRGEYDFIVNKYATNTCDIATEPDSWLIEQAPTEKEWHNSHLYFLSTRKLLKNGGWHRALFNFDTILLHLNYLCILAGLAYATFMMVNHPGESTININGFTIPNIQALIIMSAALSALIITISMRTIFAKKTMRYFDANVSPWRIVFYEIGVIWHNINYILRYKSADKNTFTSHKL